MDNVIEITTEYLHGDREDFLQETKMIGQEIERLSEKMQYLAAMWKGPAHDIFQEQMNRDIEFLRTLQGWFETYGGKLQYAEETYLKTEQSVYQEIASIRI